MILYFIDFCRIRNLVLCKLTIRSKVILPFGRSNNVWDFEGAEEGGGGIYNAFSFNNKNLALLNNLIIRVTHWLKSN